MNQVRLSHEEAIEKIRAAHRKRAEYMYFIFQELLSDLGQEKAEKILRRALKRTGQHYGSRMHRERTPSGFIRFLEGSSHEDTFDRNVRERNEDKCTFTLGYCPLIAAWKELGLDAQEIGVLCDIAMETDFGMMEELGLHLDLTRSLGSGDNLCEMVITGQKR
jgi:predicted ArsR family transcriptional regulator